MKINFGKPVIIIFLLSIILLGLFFLISFKKPAQKPTEIISPTQAPSPTTFIVTKPSPTLPEASPTLIAPTFTGVKEEELPQNELDLSQQKQELKNKLPIKEAGFTIEFDYAEDKFTVSLIEPKEKSKQDFLGWLKANYPAIPEDRFILK